MPTSNTKSSAKPPAKPPTKFHAALGASIGITILAFVFWTIALATLSDLRGSDAAGNAMAQAYSAIEIIVLWLLLAILTVIAAIKGAIPLRAGAPAMTLSRRPQSSP